MLAALFRFCNLRLPANHGLVLPFALSATISTVSRSHVLRIGGEVAMPGSLSFNTMCIQTIKRDPSQVAASNHLWLLRVFVRHPAVRPVHSTRRRARVSVSVSVEGKSGDIGAREE